MVYTSSSTAALLPQPNKKIVVTTETWDDDAVTAANGENPDGFTVYGASKTEAERAYWQAISSTHPPFQASAVLPNCNIGPILQPGAEMSSSTGTWIIKLFNGDKGLLEFPSQWFVNVQDCARLHVAALIDPQCSGKRIFAFAEPFNWNDCLAAFRRLYPGRTFMEDEEGQGRDLSEIPNQEAEELLKKHFGKGFVGLEESIRENTAMLAQ